MELLLLLAWLVLGNSSSKPLVKESVLIWSKEKGKRLLPFL